MQLCWHNFDSFHPCRSQILRYPACRSLDVRFVFASGANAGDTQKILQLLEIFGAMAFNKLNDIHSGFLRHRATCVADSLGRGGQRHVWELKRDVAPLASQWKILLSWQPGEGRCGAPSKRNLSCRSHLPRAGRLKVELQHRLRRLSNTEDGRVNRTV